MEAPKGQRVSNLCQEIASRRAKALERRIEAYPRNNCIASDLGPCTREMALAILHWKDRPLPSPELKARFERGNLIEDAVIRELETLGISVRVERRPFEIKDGKGRLVLRGRIDGFLEHEKATFPMEVKSLDPNVFRQVDSVEDFKRWIWARKYPNQLLSYLYGENLEEGFFLLDDCLGHWKLLPAVLDYAEMEQILKRCEAATAAVEAVNRDQVPEEQALPPYHTDPAVCRRCWAFGRVCYPPIEEQGLKALADPEFEQMLERWNEIGPAHREYEGLHKQVKEKVRGLTGVVVGRFLIQGEYEDRKGYEVKPSKFWKPKITVIEEGGGADG
jgi:hypothetical protein